LTVRPDGSLFERRAGGELKFCSSKFDSELFLVRSGNAVLALNNDDRLSTYSPVWPFLGRNSFKNVVVVNNKIVFKIETSTSIFVGVF
jgi:hypothetical protein